MSRNAEHDDTCVKVAIRIRPLVSREKLERRKVCLFQGQNDREVVIGENRRFTFDFVFDSDSVQLDIYNRCVSPLVDSVFSGYNATVFAYGQTGSGKTYTMGTQSSVSIPPCEQGIVPRSFEDIFSRIESIEKSEANIEFVVRCSFIEIYGEEIRDLLSPLNPCAPTIHEVDGRVVLSGVLETMVESSSELDDLLSQGSLYRITASTMMNSHSSRSHAIFTIFVDQFIESVNSSGVRTSEKRSGMFHFVDLAGSERVSKTQATGKRLQEGININKGLLSLGNVISSLGDPSKKGSHVPYRDSKLTRILQNSLGGNSKTLMITCVSPSDDSFNESLNAIKYANRAKNIENRPMINRDPASEQLAQLQHEISLLKSELADNRGSAELRQDLARALQKEEESARELNRVRESMSEMHGLYDQLYKENLQLKAKLAYLDDNGSRSESASSSELLISIARCPAVAP